MASALLLAAAATAAGCRAPGDGCIAEYGQCQTNMICMNDRQFVRTTIGSCELQCGRGSCFGGTCVVSGGPVDCPAGTRCVFVGRGGMCLADAGEPDAAPDDGARDVAGPDTSAPDSSADVADASGD